MLSKILPFSRKISMAIFIKYTENDQNVRKGVNIFEFMCVLVLLSYASMMSKLQCNTKNNLVLMILFNLAH